MKVVEAVESYIARRRSEGAQFNNASSVLRNLCRYCGDLDLSQLSTDIVKAFLNIPVQVVTRNSKLSAVWCFARYYFLRGAMPELFLERPMRHRHFRLPMIYTRNDISALLSGIEGCRWQRDEIDSATLRTLLVLLYATGITVEEALTTRRSSIEIDRHCIVLAGTYSMPYRVLPIGSDLQKLLSDYLALSTIFTGDTLLFRHRSGESIKRNHLWQRFKRLHKQAGIGTKNGRNPSPRDLRSTFAVHRLTEWLQAGENLNELVPALSTYMGYASLTKAEQFLAYSPERFREDLCKLSPTKPVKHWREEPELLKFLLSL